MKSGLGTLVRREQEEYLVRLLPPRDALRREIELQAERDGVPISDPEVGRLLETLAAASRARRIVEVGGAIGYGAICLARGAPGAVVESIESDPVRAAAARSYLERAGLAERVTVIEGDALEVLRRREGPIDLAYVDCVKTDYRRYLDLLLPHLVVGGMLVFDNVLWKGQVAVEAEEEGPEARALRAFNGYLMIHPQLAAVILPLGDGVGLATKTRPLISEMGGPW